LVDTGVLDDLLVTEPHPVHAVRRRREGKTPGRLNDVEEMRTGVSSRVMTFIK